MECCFRRRRAVVVLLFVKNSSINSAFKIFSVGAIDASIGEFSANCGVTEAYISLDFFSLLTAASSLIFGSVGEEPMPPAEASFFGGFGGEFMNSSSDDPFPRDDGGGVIVKSGML